MYKVSHLTFEMLEPSNVWHFCLTNYLNSSLIKLAVDQFSLPVLSINRHHFSTTPTSTYWCSSNLLGLHCDSWLKHSNTLYGDLRLIVFYYKLTHESWFGICAVQPGVLIQYYISVMTDVFVEDEVFIGSRYEWVPLVGQWDRRRIELNMGWCHQRSAEGRFLTRGDMRGQNTFIHKHTSTGQWRWLMSWSRKLSGH